MSREAQVSSSNGMGSSAVNNFGSVGSMKTASLTEIWQDLKAGIEAVYSQQTMSKPRYMTLYS